MKHEEIEVGKQYTINADRPFESNLSKGEQVKVVGEHPTPFPGNPCHFKVESLKEPNESGFEPTWVVPCEILDPAAAEFDPETGIALDAEE